MKRPIQKDKLRKIGPSPIRGKEFTVISRVDPEKRDLQRGEASHQSRQKIRECDVEQGRQNNGKSRGRAERMMMLVHEAIIDHGLSGQAHGQGALSDKHTPCLATDGDCDDQKRHTDESNGGFVLILPANELDGGAHKKAGGHPRADGHDDAKVPRHVRAMIRDQRFFDLVEALRAEAFTVSGEEAKLLE